MGSLAVSPLRRFAGLNLLTFRRAVGLLAFFYLVVHLLVWLVLDVQILAQVWADILKRPYITVGMAGFLALVPLAVTSNDWAVRRLGAPRIPVAYAPPLEDRARVSEDQIVEAVRAMTAPQPAS